MSRYDVWVYFDPDDVSEEFEDDVIDAVGYRYKTGSGGDRRGKQDVSFQFASKRGAVNAVDRVLGLRGSFDVLVSK